MIRSLGILLIAATALSACRLWQPGRLTEEGTRHGRTITWELASQGRDLFFKGSIESDAPHCTRGEDVIVERRDSPDADPEVVDVLVSRRDGTFVARILTRPGLFRAAVSETAACEAAASEDIQIEK